MVSYDPTYPLLPTESLEIRPRVEILELIFSQVNRLNRTPGVRTFLGGRDAHCLTLIPTAHSVPKQSEPVFHSGTIDNLLQSQDSNAHSTPRQQLFSPGERWRSSDSQSGRFHPLILAGFIRSLCSSLIEWRE